MMLKKNSVEAIKTKKTLHFVLKIKHNPEGVPPNYNLGGQKNTPLTNPNQILD